MASYFDHFIITKILTGYITDSFIIMVCVILLYITLNYKFYIIPSRFQNLMEVIINH